MSVALRSVIAFMSVAFMSAALFALLLLPQAASAAKLVATAILVMIFIWLSSQSLLGPAARAFGATICSYG
jgi:hypothetical protein